MEESIKDKEMKNISSPQSKKENTEQSIEEKEIRNKVSSRTTDLLKKVFALQD